MPKADAAPVRSSVNFSKANLKLFLLLAYSLGEGGSYPGLVQFFFLIFTVYCFPNSKLNLCVEAMLQYSTCEHVCFTMTVYFPVQMFAQFVPFGTAAQDKFSGSCCMETFNEGK